MPFLGLLFFLSVFCSKTMKRQQQFLKLISRSQFGFCYKEIMNDLNFVLFVRCTLDRLLQLFRIRCHWILYTDLNIAIKETRSEINVVTKKL